MPGYSNIGLFLKNTSNKNLIIEQIQANKFLEKYLDLSLMQGALYSSITLNRLIDEELRHDHFVIHSDKNTGLFSMSSGERKKALLKHLIAQNPQYFILDDIYSNIDIETQKTVQEELAQLGNSIILIQIFFRKKDILPGIKNVFSVDENNQIVKEEFANEFNSSKSNKSYKLHQIAIPESYIQIENNTETLVELNAISANYGSNQVLNNINWTIKRNEFWQLTGPNGSGKSTLVSMITGDNPFGYGQNLFLFGRKKGSGESIWDIKQKIGYFTPLMIHRFNHNDSVENMIISGFKDSVGLYSKASNLQRRIAKRWIDMLGTIDAKQKFNQISVGQQRMVMVARAMVKHPPLLILDEPTIELDDENSLLFVEMINAIKSENNTAIIYVSHREENGLKPGNIFELVPSYKGFTGLVKQVKDSSLYGI